MSTTFVCQCICALMRVCVSHVFALPIAVSYIDLLLNKEGYTGYEGYEAHRVWQTIYETNCFHGKCTI